MNKNRIINELVEWIYIEGSPLIIIGKLIRTQERVETTINNIDEKLFWNLLSKYMDSRYKRESPPQIEWRK